MWDWETLYMKNGHVVRCCSAIALMVVGVSRRRDADSLIANRTLCTLNNLTLPAFAPLTICFFVYI